VTTTGAVSGFKSQRKATGKKNREITGKEKTEKTNGTKNTETRRKEKQRSNAETRIGPAIVFIPVEKRTTQKLFSTESRHLHHLLSSFIIQEVAVKRK
jgi:hypothetical protein